MSAMQKVHTLVTAGTAARTEKLMSLMQGIDKAIGESRGTVQSIKDRGFTTNLFSSSREDLLQIAESQNTINGLMLEMIQEIVVVNTMGYVFLASVIGDFMRSVDEGWTDSDGKFHVLSQTGKEFAHTASEIFISILNGTRATQEKIDSSAAAITELRAHFTQLDEIIAAQTQELLDLREEQTLTNSLTQEFKDLTVQAGREKEERLAALESTGDAWFQDIGGLRLALRMQEVRQHNLIRKLLLATGGLSVVVLLLAGRALGFF